MSTTTNASYGQPALIGGVVMGVLSALPLISAFNLCCCMWVVAGGMVAAYLLQQNQATPITPGDGALVGLLAGLIGAFVQFVLSIPIGIAVAPMDRAILQRAIEMTDNIDIREAIERYSNANSQFGVGFMILGRLVWFVIGLFVGAIFSTAGGAIGAMIFRKPPPSGVIDVPPAS